MTDLAALVRLHQANRLDEALAGYLEIAASAPEYSEARRLAGVAELQRGRPAQAIAYFEDALAANPGAVDALVNRAAALRQLGKLDAIRSRSIDDEVIESSATDALPSGDDAVSILRDVTDRSAS